MKTYLKIAATVALLCSSEGCALDGASSESDVQTANHSVITKHYVVYSYKDGRWKLADYRAGNKTNPSVTTGQPGAFGASDDTPFLWKTQNSPPFPGNIFVRIGTYGTTGSRRGWFYFDDSGDREWGDGDSETKFLSTPQSADKPFVLTAQLWGPNGSGQCAPRTNGNGNPIVGRMIGIVRGTTVYLDKNGDGTYALAGCDSKGTISTGDDLPSGVPSSSSTSGGQVLALARPSGNQVTWYYDNNLDLRWAEPPDWTSPVNAFGDTNQDFPPSHPNCIGTRATEGTTVYYDTNCNGIWETSDAAYSAALPADWDFAGVGEYLANESSADI